MRAKARILVPIGVLPGLTAYVICTQINVIIQIIRMSHWADTLGYPCRLSAPDSTDISLNFIQQKILFSADFYIGMEQITVKYISSI